MLHAQHRPALLHLLWLLLQFVLQLLHHQQLHRGALQQQDTQRKSSKTQTTAA